MGSEPQSSPIERSALVADPELKPTFSASWCCSKTQPKGIRMKHSPKGKSQGDSFPTHCLAVDPQRRTVPFSLSVFSCGNGRLIPVFSRVSRRVEKMIKSSQT